MTDQREDKRSFYEKYGAAITPVLVMAIFSIAGVIVTNMYQSKNSATQLISEREKAESELRASMFKDLIGPIVGDTRKIPPERERLLVELLALNFGEHFELKPLLRQVDKKITDARKAARNKARREQLDQERDSLRSIARRVTTRQIAMLLNQGVKGDSTVIIPLAFIQWAKQEDRNLFDMQTQVKDLYDKLKQVKEIGNGDAIKVCSPDQRYTALVAINKCDWESQTCAVHVNVLEEECLLTQAETDTNNTKTDSTQHKNVSAADVEFEFGWFDFPMNDNTLLSDGNRFALVMQDMDVDLRTVAFDFVWFPKVFFSPRERPINYADIRKNLGMKPNR
jgi:hypothetical protein